MDGSLNEAYNREYDDWFAAKREREKREAMDKLPHLPTLADWEAIKDDATAFAVWRQALEDRVKKLEKRMSRVEKLGKHAEMPNGKAAAKRIDRRDREVV